MAAYAVNAHIDHARPHRPGSVRQSDAAVTVLDDRHSLALTAAPEDLTSTLFAGLDSECQEPVAKWSETTFFLFDPESWR